VSSFWKQAEERAGGWAIHELMQNSKTILVVDYDRVMLRNIEWQLQSIGCNIVSTTDASEAIGLVSSVKPDLILLSVAFPPDVAHGGGSFTDGFFVLSWLRRMNEAKAIPTFMINGEDTPEHVERARSAGAEGYFPSPINLEALKAVAAQWLGEPSSVPS